MAKAGDVFDNPVSGETVTVIASAAETNGQLFRWEHALRPGARVPYDHVHAKQEERFEVTEGTATVRLGDKTLTLGPGEIVVIPVGTPHGLRNETDGVVRVCTEVRPARQTERYFELVFALAQQGKVGKRGLPNPLRLAVIARAAGHQDYLLGVPVVVQRWTVTALALVGRLFGYRAE